MKKSIIVVDSGVDLPKSYIEEHNLVFVPLSYTFGEAVFTDDVGTSLPVVEFYQKLREGQFSVTSQATPNAYIETITPYLQKGMDILYIAFSSALSGTHQSAMLAKEILKQKFTDRRIIIVDSLSASLGQGLLVDYAVQMHENGEDIAQIAEWIIDNRQNIQHWFTVDDINHLFRGGRVSRVDAFAGTLLSIKPILHINNEGRLVPISKVRGRRHALNTLVKQMEHRGENKSGQKVFISHGDSPADAAYAANMITQ